MTTRADVPHWLKYVRWEVISRWRGRARKAAGTLRYPYAFASRDRAFPAISGGVLWLMSSPRYGIYRQPPSVVARLEISDVVPAGHPKADHVDPEVRKFGPWIAIATRRRDAYLPLNNVTDTLYQLRFRGRVTRLPRTPDLPDDQQAKNPYAHIPQRFQRHRVIAPGSIDLLESFAEAVRLGRRVFVSYRRIDFDEAWVDELATLLGDHTVSCWLDKRNVPQNEAVDFDDGLLGAILDDAVRQSSCLVALMRSGYVENATTAPASFVRDEWDGAGSANIRRRRHRMHRVAVLFGEQPAAHELIDRARDHVITVPAGATPATVARHVLPLLPAMPAVTASR